MVNDLLNVENIHSDFCLYEIFYEVYTPEHKFKRTDGTRGVVRASWSVNKTFYNVRDWRDNPIKCIYRFGMDRQLELARKHSAWIDKVIQLLDKLFASKLVPFSLHYKVSEMEKFKVKYHTVKKSINKEFFDRIKMNKYTFRTQIISYLMQKREDIIILLNEDDRILYDRMIKLFTDMNTATTNYVTFDEAVEKMYDKAVEGWNNDV